MSQSLKLVSWNVFVLNPRIADACAFIRDMDFDVLCLQEVPDALLEQLRSLPYHLVSSIDTIWVTDAHHPDRGESTMHHVILSKHPIVAHTAYAASELPTRMPWQTHFYYFLRYHLRMWRGGAMRARTFISANINVSDTTIRVFSAHLPLYTPQIRMSEFRSLCLHLSENIPNIVCGDFNVLDNWLMRPLNWLQGGSFASAMPWTHERADMQEQFKMSGFINPLHAKNTHKFAGCQLDHILVPIDTPTSNAQVIPELYGSDHYPVTVTIEV